jgi:hypothetical protein
MSFQIVIKLGMEWATDCTIENSASVLRLKQAQPTGFVTHPTPTLIGLRAAPDLGPRLLYRLALLLK